MNSFERFKNKQKRRDAAVEHTNARFVFTAYNTTVITDGQTEIEAAVVSQQEKDKGYIYTHFQDTLVPGQVWETNNLHFLIVEEIINIKDTDYHKYYALLCNVDLGITWGYFRSNLNIKEEQETVLISRQNPTLTIPSAILDFEDKIVLQNRPWIIQEYDSISQPGVTVYSLKASTVSKEEKQNSASYIVKPEREEAVITTEEIEISDTEKAIGFEIPITLATHGGYFKYDAPINIIKRTGNAVTFTLPFGVEEVHVSVKQNGEVVTYHYYGVN